MLRTNSQGQCCLSFLLLPGYSMASVQAAIDPLRLVNELRGEAFYRWQLLSLDNQVVVASNGLVLPAESFVGTQPDNLFVCAGRKPWRHGTSGLFAWLQLRQQQKALLGGIDNGSYLLAEAGVLYDAPVSIHWQAAAGFHQRFPELKMSQAAYEIGENLVTCSGGLVTSELILNLIEQQLGHAISQTVAQHLILPERQSEPSDLELLRIHEPRIYCVLKLMQSHLSQPLTLSELAEQADISVRQLERLFKRYLQSAPASYYMRLRLEHARLLLHNSP